LLPSKQGTAPLQTELGNIVEHTNHYILVQLKFSRSSDARLTNKIQLKALIGACG